MKYLNQFIKFDWKGFALGKRFLVTGIREWTDYSSKQKLGWRVDCVISADDTPYKTKDGEVGSNLYEKITFKTPGKPNVSISDSVEPVDAEATVYGDFRNQLSVRAADVIVVAAPAVPEKGKG